jgi:hypothetical protein
MLVIFFLDFRTEKHSRKGSEFHFGKSLPDPAMRLFLEKSARFRFYACDFNVRTLLKVSKRENRSGGRGC